MRACATAPSQRSVPTLSMPICLLRTTSLPLSMYGLSTDIAPS